VRAATHSHPHYATFGLSLRLVTQGHTERKFHFLAQPQHMFSAGRGGHTIENTDQLTGTDMFSGEKTFSVDWSIMPGGIGFGSWEP